MSRGAQRCNMKFTDAQQQAIEHLKGNVQLIACAGSGKTEVIARRVVTLLTSVEKGGGGCTPANIVAFTFTDKAAGELKDRIHVRCRDTFGAITGLAEMYIGTIHGFCLDLLKSEVPQYMKYEVLNEVQQALFVDRHSRMSGLTQSSTLGGQQLKRFVDTRHYVAALSILREDVVTDASKLAGCSVAENLGVYEKLLHDKGYLDYSEILKEAVSALRQNAELRKRLKARIRHVIVDEYQDVNPVQEAVVATLHALGASVCVVGDDDQTLYQWRGSDVGNILSFDVRYPGVTRVQLEENFRSSEGVVAVASQLVKRVVRRLPKEMKATTAQDCAAGDIVALPFDTPEEEAA
jgi:DNA helicase-2/ATP-dependent DNA helicase PcrA